MTTRIEIKNEGPANVEIEIVTPSTIGSNSKRILKPKEIDSFLYVYQGQQIVVTEKLSEN